ncbi:MAG: hypothetical protein ACLSVG_00015 [Clostridia bacterium]
MDAIIAKILEIEHRSCEIVREAEDKRDTLDEILDAKREELRKAIFSGEEKRLENDKILVLNKAHNEAQEQESYAKEKIAAMESFERKHREEWLNELYHRITRIEKG